jgi:hypothetical protein
MAGSGSAWIKHTKHKGLRAAAITDAPHPAFAREGQRYFPLDSRARTRSTLRVTRVLDGECELRREDGTRSTVRLKTRRLLAVDADGVGRHYRFIGYAPRAGYATHIHVVADEGAWTRVVCPEWHPELTIAVAAAALPASSRDVGSWLACRADLSADAPARLQPRRFAVVDPLFNPSRYHAVHAPSADADGAARERPESGPGCGDVVLYVAAAEVEQIANGASGVYLTGHAPPVRSGSRAYLHATDRVHGWRSVRQLRPLPNGSRVVLEGAWHPVAGVPASPPPLSGVQDGRHGRQLWAWRSWPLHTERP